MAALVVTGPGRFDVCEVERPSPGPDEVLIRVRYSAICGSDLKLIRGLMEDITFPLIPGHEWSGEVAQAPPAFRHLLGSPVVSDILQSCGVCTYCQRGYHNLCTAMTEPGISTSGAFAEYVLVKAKQVHPLPSTLPLTEACMVEPLAVVLYAAHLLRVEGGECVLIIGGGAIGQLLAQAVRLAGAAKVIVADHHDERLDIARRLGADETLNPKTVDPLSFFADEPALMPDLVFEASGDPQAFKHSLDIVKPGGRVGVIGYAGRGDVIITPSIIMRKLLHVRGVLSPTGTWEQAIDLLSRKKICVTPLLTHRFSLGHFPEAFDIATHRSDGAVRVVIEP